MHINTYFGLLGCSTILSWAAFILILVKLNPYGDFHVALSLGIFYFTLFLALCGTFTICVGLLHAYNEGGRMLYSHLSTAFRQGSLLALFAVGLLALQGLRMLSWWEATLFAAGLACLEFLFLARYR